MDAPIIRRLIFILIGLIILLGSRKGGAQQVVSVFPASQNIMNAVFTSDSTALVTLSDRNKEWVKGYEYKNGKWQVDKRSDTFVQNQGVVGRWNDQVFYFFEAHPDYPAYENEILIYSDSWKLVDSSGIFAQTHEAGYTRNDTMEIISSLQDRYHALFYRTLSDRSWRPLLGLDKQSIITPYLYHDSIFFSVSDASKGYNLYKASLSNLENYELADQPYNRYKTSTIAFFSYHDRVYWVNNKNGRYQVFSFYEPDEISLIERLAEIPDEYADYFVGAIVWSEDTIQLIDRKSIMALDIKTDAYRNLLPKGFKYQDEEISLQERVAEIPAEYADYFVGAIVWSEDTVRLVDRKSIMELNLKTDSRGALLPKGFQLPLPDVSLQDQIAQIPAEYADYFVGAIVWSEDTVQLIDKKSIMALDIKTDAAGNLLPKGWQLPLPDISLQERMAEIPDEYADYFVGAIVWSEDTVQIIDRKSIMALDIKTDAQGRLLPVDIQVQFGEISLKERIAEIPVEYADYFVGAIVWREDSIQLVDRKSILALDLKIDKEGRLTSSHLVDSLYKLLPRKFHSEEELINFMSVVDIYRVHLQVFAASPGVYELESFKKMFRMHRYQVEMRRGKGIVKGKTISIDRFIIPVQDIEELAFFHRSLQDTFPDNFGRLYIENKVFEVFWSIENDAVFIILRPFDI